MAEAVDETQELLDQIVAYATEVSRRRALVENAEAELIEAERMLLDVVHRTRTGGVPWREISFRVGRAQGLPAYYASRLGSQLRKELHVFRRQTGRWSKSRLRLLRRKTVTEEHA